MHHDNLLPPRLAIDKRRYETKNHGHKVFNPALLDDDFEL